MSCRCSISCTRSGLARSPAPIRGGRRVWNGERRRRRRRTTSNRRHSLSAAPTSITWRRRKMKLSHPVLTPEESAELERTVLSRHLLEEQYANLEQQHDTANFGMWVFLVTEVLLFGSLFLGVAV